MKTITLEQIRQLLPNLDILSEIEEGFKAYSEGRVEVPPVGEMILDRGEVHIKYGFIRGDDFYVIKIASGFYNNPQIGLPSGNGLMLLFSQHTGELVSTLLDEGYLTNVRTAVAGAIVARYLAPSTVNQIGMVGAGIQARLQLSYLRKVVDCNKVLVWGQSQEKLDIYCREMEQEGFRIGTTLEISRIMDQCNLIVTTTPSKIPILPLHGLRRGIHITAVGSDTVEKQELDARILGEADLVVADSIAQCMSRGEIFQAMKAGTIRKEEIHELGEIISGREKGRTNDGQISVADLTGVAVQDINIASAIYRATEV